MRRWTTLLAVVLVAAAACKKANNQGSGAGSGAGSSAGTGAGTGAAPGPDTDGDGGPDWLEADPSKPLAETLREEATAAVKAGKKPHAYLHADWCDPCVVIERTRSDPKMKAAFAGTHIIAIDVDMVEQLQIEAAGMQARVLPIFYRLDDKGKPTGSTIDGGAWGVNTPDNIAPPLAAFFAK